MSWRIGRYLGFSLVEVVIALGVVGFAIVAILGVLPVGLKTSHSAQDQTRSAQIAQDILTSLASQAQSKYPSLVINQESTINQVLTQFSYPIDLSTNGVYTTLAADNDGRLIQLANATDVMRYPFQVVVQVSDATAEGFDPSDAKKVTVRVISPPSTNAGPSTAQTVNDTVRIISKY